MAKDKNSFVLYANYINIFKTLTKEQAGELIILIFDYVNDLNPEEPTDQAVKVAWAMIKNQLKDDLKRYEDKRNQNRANVNKRYQKNSIEYENVQTNTNVNERTNSYYVNDNVNVNVNVNDIDKDNYIKDNLERENNNAYTHNDLIIELINMIREHYSSDLTIQKEDRLYERFEYLLSQYTEFNVKMSTYHVIAEMLGKETLDNPIGYLWNAIAINCEQFKNERG